MERVSPHVHMFPNVWDNENCESNQQPLVIKKQHEENDHVNSCNRIDYLIPNKKIMINPNIYTIDLLSDDQTFDNANNLSKITNENELEEFISIDRLFVLENVLSKDECQDLISVYHSGDFVKEGYKYVVRTEMIFKRIDSDSVYRENYLESAQFQKVKQLVDQSDQLEKEGNVALSTKKYIQAHELQTNKSRSIESVDIFYSIGLLPEEIFLLIFSYLKTEDISKTFIKIDRNLNSITRHSLIWKERYREKWSTTPKVPLNKENGFKRGYYYQMEAEERIEEGIITSVENEITIQYESVFDDWYHAFVMRSNQEKFFEVVLLDIVGGNLRFGLSSQSLFYISQACAGRPSCGHFQLLGYDYESIVCGDRFFVTSHMCDELPLLEKNGTISDMNNFKEMIIQLYRDDLKKSKATPLLLSVPVVWTTKQLSTVSTELTNMGFEIIFIDEATLRSYYYQKPNCLIIKLTEYGTYFVPVKENEMLRQYYYFKDMNIQTKYPSLHKVAFIPSSIDESVLNILPVDAGSFYTPVVVNKEERLEIGKTILEKVLDSIVEYKHLLTSWEIDNNITDNIIIVGEFAHLENMQPVLIDLLRKFFPNSSFTYQDNRSGKGGKVEYLSQMQKMGHRGGSFDVVGGAKIICSLNNFIESYYEKRTLKTKHEKSKCVIA